MVNSPSNHSRRAMDLPENLSVKDIVETFKKSLAIKEDNCPSFAEVQEALRIFLIHMRAIGPLHMDFIQSILSQYSKSSMEDPDKDSFLGLQGYIRYIDKRILDPLLIISQEDNEQPTPEELQKDVILIRIAIHELREKQGRILSVIDNPQLLQARSSLVVQDQEYREAVKSIELLLENSQIQVDRLTKKKD